MPRPAIIIGIGGTGSWVLSWLKKDLLETYGTLENQPIRLLLLDTADVIAEVGAAGMQQANGNAAAQGYSRYIILDEEREYVQIPTDQQDSYTRQIKTACLNHDPGVSHISKWWQADFYPDAMLRLKDGAGQFRQLGRLALMQGLHLHGDNDKVYATISNMIDAVTRISSQQGLGGSLDVHITGSLLGGTGSGIFIDIAWLVRKILEARGDTVQPFITGFFALPTAFSPQPRLDTRMKAFAAWRELNRMMTVRERESEFFVRWGQQDTTTFQVRKEVYDHVYLIDKGVGGPGTLPQESVFPVMAEAISFYLDSKAGMDYIQHIRTNLVNPRQTAPLRGNPTYSVLNVKSWKLPSYHTVRVARHQFAREFLRRLLQIEDEQTQNYANPAGERATYTIKADPRYRQRSNEIFKAPMQDTGSTYLLDDIAWIAQIQPNNFHTEAQDRAYNSTSLGIYAQMPQTPDGIAIQNMLDEGVNFAVPAMIDSNSNGDLDAHLDMIQRLLYGPNRNGGKYLDLYGDFVADQFKGKLYDDLVHAHSFHLDVFQRRVRVWMILALNEPSNAQFSGLACVRTAITQLDQDLKRAIEFYTEVKGALESINAMQGNADAQYNIAASAVSQRGIPETVKNAAGFGAKREVNLYTQHENVNNNTKRDHRTVERMINTVRQMQEHIETNVLPRIEAIVQQLVTDNDFTRVSGLYRGVTDSLADEDERHEFDLRLGNITEVLQVDAQIDVNTDKIDELLGRTRWSIDADMNLRVEINVSPDPRDPPITLESNMRDPRKTLELVNRLVDGVASYVVFADNNQTALNVMGVNQLTNALPGLVGNYLHYDNLQKPAVKDIRTFYVRAAVSQNEQAQINNALNTLNIPRNSTNSVKVVDSANRNKVTVFSARELIMPESFAEWEATQNGYKLMVMGDANRNIKQDLTRVLNDHLFAAEREALRLEFQAANENAVNPDLPILDQRLVHLLEEHGRFDQFLDMWALGWIFAERDDPADPDTFWRIHFPEEYGFPILTLAQRDQVDMLGLIARFAIYGRTLQGRNLNYVQVEKTLDESLRRIRGSRQDMESLIKIYQFEAQSAITLERVVQTQLGYTGGQLEPDSMKTRLDRTTAELQRPEHYREPTVRKALAEEIAYDLTRYDQNSSPLVTDVNAHLQAMSILLRLKYTNMARLLQQFMSQR